MKMYKFLFALVLCCLQAACANTAHLKEDLKPVKSDNYVIFQEDVFYLQKRGIGVEWKEGLSKGVYRPEYENVHGTFYRGPEGCVAQFMGANPMGPFDGGIWIPKDKINSSPRIYYYFKFNRSDANRTGGALITGILSAYENDITFMPPVDKGTFLDRIAVTNIPLK